jgi:hypothetical protein
MTADGTYDNATNNATFVNCRFEYVSIFGQGITIITDDSSAPYVNMPLRLNVTDCFFNNTMIYLYPDGSVNSGFNPFNVNIVGCEFNGYPSTEFVHFDYAECGNNSVIVFTNNTGTTTDSGTRLFYSEIAANYTIAFNNYTNINGSGLMVYTDNAHYLKQKTLKYYEEHLPAEEFLRVHRSYIVRIDKIICDSDIIVRKIKDFLYT